MNKKVILKNPSHSFKECFKNLGIPQNTVAHSVGIPYQRIFRYLNGYAQMPQEVEVKLKSLIVSLKKGGEAK
ncbi:helix-turn-helix domain-containing protein [Thermodesulfobacteriota bacterium]